MLEIASFYFHFQSKRRFTFEFSFIRTLAVRYDIFFTLHARDQPLAVDTLTTQTAGTPPSRVRVPLSSTSKKSPFALLPFFLLSPSLAVFKPYAAPVWTPVANRTVDLGGGEQQNPRCHTSTHNSVQPIWPG
jgi:hypothetical protein